MTVKALLDVIVVDFDVRNNLLIIYIAVVKYLKKKTAVQRGNISAIYTLEQIYETNWVN